MKKQITVSNSTLCGKITCPCSKSEAHRAIIASCFCKDNRPHVIENIVINDDIAATISAMQSLGAHIVKKDCCLLITPILNLPKKTVIDCNESGSTLRFIIPIAAALGIDTVFCGKGRLPERPIDIFIDVLKKHGIKILPSDKTKGEILHISGTMKGGTFKVSGNISSQFITGLMFALPLIKKQENTLNKIIITNEITSQSYIKLTSHVLKKFGITAELENRQISIGKSNYTRNLPYKVEGDYSSAAFFICAGAIASKENGITIDNLFKDSYQGDKKIIDILKNMGANIEVYTNHIKIKKSSLHSAVIDAADIPDLVPILCIAACFANGKTTINNVKRLKYKESDRLEAMYLNLKKMKADIKICNDDNTIIINKSELFAANINTYSDHRIVMSFCIAALIAKKGDVTLNDIQAVSKSYPQFFEHFKLLGGVFK